MTPTVVSWLNSFLFYSILFFHVHSVTFVSSLATKLDNDARLRHDFSQCRAMLKELRRSEDGFEDGSIIAASPGWYTSGIQ